MLNDIEPTLPCDCRVFISPAACGQHRRGSVEEVRCIAEVDVRVGVSAFLNFEIRNLEFDAG